MKILAFDTTNSLASVAIMSDGIELSFKVTRESSSQAELLFKLIREALEESSLNMSDIDLVSVTNGPGSFTGVRVGLAAALGMQFACEAQFITLSNFQVLAYSIKGGHKDITVVLDARREQIYVQSFNYKLEKISQPEILLLKDLFLEEDKLFIGDGLKQEGNSLMINADARLLAQASEFYFKQNMFGDMSPLYIREPDVMMSKA
jgi:tRNA threonylcarbamoyladenosine biosynthesis protein TsaB